MAPQPRPHLHRTRPPGDQETESSSGASSARFSPPTSFPNCSDSATVAAMTKRSYSSPQAPPENPRASPSATETSSPTSANSAHPSASPRNGQHPRLPPPLPFLGSTVTLWFPIIEGIDLVTYPSPMEPSASPSSSTTTKIYLLLSTPTFLRGYMRRIDPEQLSSLRMIRHRGRELPSSVADAFEKKFGKRPLEGYGLTETSPPATSICRPPRSPKTTKPLFFPNNDKAPLETSSPGSPSRSPMPPPRNPPPSINPASSG